MNDELTEYYVNLLILQYRNKTKVQGTISALVYAIMIYDLIRLVEDGYDLDTAVGTQLDVLAKYYGPEREITGLPFTRDYFGFIRYGEAPATSIFEGFSLYGAAQDVQFIRYGDTDSSILDLNDEEFRQVLKLKRIQNVSNNSVGEIDAALFAIYGTDVKMDDNKDMTMTYTFPSNQVRLATIMQSTDVLPRPAGVEAEIVFT